MWKFPGWGKYGILAVVGLALVLSHLWIRLQVVSAGYALADAQQLISALQEEHHALTIEWEAATAPSHLSQLASDRLGLSVPRPEQIVILP